MSSIHPYYFCLLTLVFLVTECAAFPGGAAHYSCESLKPGHGDDHTSLSNNTFRVRVSSLEVPAGDTLNVLIDGTGNSFRGFLVKSVIKGTNIYFGKFVPGVNTVSRCERSGLTHDDGKVNKTERVLKWVAPGDVKRKVSVEFRSSIVYNYDSYYYVNSRSVLVVPTTTPTPTPAPARPPPTSKDAPKPREPTPRRNAPQKDNFQETLSPQARRQITQEENHSHEELNLPLDPACGHSVGCFHDCEVGYCSFIVTWKDKGEVIHFHMKKIEPSRSERWMAIGFSDDEYMGDDSCVECVIDRGVVNVYSSYNEDKTNKRMTDKTAGLKNAAGSYVNGVLECSFDRIKKDDFYTKLKNLEDDVYLMFADGEAITGNLFPHDYQKLPDISPTKVDLQSFANVGGEGPVFPLVRAHDPGTGCDVIIVLIPAVIALLGLE